MMQAGVVSAFNRAASGVAVPMPAFKVDDAQLESLLRHYFIDLTAKVAQSVSESPYLTKGNVAAKESLRYLRDGTPFMVAFTGDPGVDTTYMLPIMAQHMAEDSSLKNARLLELDWYEAGRSQFSRQAVDNLLPLFKGLAERKGVFKGRKIILGIGDADCYNADAMKMSITSTPRNVKIFIENFYAQIFEGRIGVVMTATEQGASQLLDKEAGLARRMEKFKVQPIDQACPLRLMQKIKLKKRQNDA